MRVISARPLPDIMTNDWSHGLFNCFDDLGICIIAYFAPCVIFGRNAEAVGEGSCLLCGCAFFVPIFNIIEAINIRGKIREQQGIGGTTLGDLLAVLCCPVCALAQEAMEIKEIPGLLSMCRE